MIIQILSLVASAALSTESNTLSTGCSIQNTSPAGQWKFVRVQEEGNDEILYAQAIKGGDINFLDFPGKRIRIDSKLPGDIAYRRGTVSVCTGGYVIRI